MPIKHTRGNGSYVNTPGIASKLSGMALAGRKWKAPEKI